MKKAAWLSVSVLLACSCGPADDASDSVTPVAGELSPGPTRVKPTVACSSDTCNFKNLDPLHAQQGLSTLSYSTYLGFGGEDHGSAVAVDPAGNTYVIGGTRSFGGSYNVFVAKMSPTGQNIYFTYFPGADAESNRRDIAVDGSGNAYIVAAASNGSILAKLNPSGSAFVYYGTVPWGITGLAVDSFGNAYTTGTYGGGSTKGTEVIVSKLNPTGSAFVYNVTFGGTSADLANDIAVDSSANVYVVGLTYSSNFPLRNAFQPTFSGGNAAFVTKLNASGTGLIYSTYLGGGGTWGEGIALDSTGSAYVTGSAATDFPVSPGAAQRSFGGALDGYVAKLSATGALVYATYLGGSDIEHAGGIAVDSNSGTAYVLVNSYSSNLPVSYNSFQSTYRGGGDAFVAQVNPWGTEFSYSTYLGGSGNDGGAGIALDSSRNVYLTGGTDSGDFPTSVYGFSGAVDAFVTKFNGP